MPLHGRQDLDGRKEIKPQIETGVLIAQRDIGVGRKMEDDFWPRSGENRLQLAAIKDIGIVEVKPLPAAQMTDVLFPAEIEVIKARHFVAAGQQRIAKVAADKTRAAGYQDSHLLLQDKAVDLTPNLDLSGQSNVCREAWRKHIPRRAGLR